VAEITTINKDISLQKEYVNIHYLLDDIISSFRKQYPEVNFIKRYDPSIPDVPLDSDYMRRVIVNILVKEHNGILRYIGNSTFEILIPYKEVS